jgi:hypothetical protein
VGGSGSGPSVDRGGTASILGATGGAGSSVRGAGLTRGSGSGSRGAGSACRGIGFVEGGAASGASGILRLVPLLGSTGSGALPLRSLSTAPPLDPRSSRVESLDLVLDLVLSLDLFFGVVLGLVLVLGATLASGEEEAGG